VHRRLGVAQGPVAGKIACAPGLRREPQLLSGLDGAGLGRHGRRLWADDLRGHFEDGVGEGKRKVVRLDVEQKIYGAPEASLG
jgi:hypothetical protein